MLLAAVQGFETEASNSGSERQVEGEALEHRIFGTECEYALFHQPPHHANANQRRAIRAGGETLLEHLRGLSNLLVLALHARGTPRAGEFLGNGGRFYIDRGGHPEYATPECRLLKDVVAHEKAGDRLAQELVELVRVRLAQEGISGTLHIFKNNIDFHGNSYGSHENYLVTPQAMERVQSLIPFLVTRQIFTGAGRLHADIGRAGKEKVPVRFGLSQRAELIDRVFSDRTSQVRGIINTRKREIHKPGENLRLHVILGDSNLAEPALALKLGITALVLRLLEEGALEDVPRFAQPVQAFKGISRWFHSAHETEEGGARYSALEMQQLYLERAQRFFSSIEPNAEEKAVLSRWEEILTGLSRLRLSQPMNVLEDDPGEVTRRVDWALKLWLLTRTVEQQRLDWSDPRLMQLDVRYHDLDPQTGIFERCQSLNMVDREVDDETILAALSNPPEDTRAWMRGRIIEQTSNRNVEVTVDNWETMKVVAKDKTLQPVHFFNRHKRLVNSLRISLKDPFVSQDHAIQRKVGEFLEIWGGE